jgi:hypothetical protein
LRQSPIATTQNRLQPSAFQAVAGSEFAVNRTTVLLPYTRKSVSAASMPEVSELLEPALMFCESHKWHKKYFLALAFYRRNLTLAGRNISLNKLF